MELPKLSIQCLKLLQKLEEADRVLLMEMLRTHLAACLRNGSPIESLERFLIEGAEIIRMEAAIPATKMLDDGPAVREWPRQSYPQYVSPKGDY